MPSDIVISVRFNDISKIRKSELYHKDEVIRKIKDAMKELENKIKDLTTEIVVINDDKQKAIDIGFNILNLIEEKAQEKVDGISLCRG